jgi:hypothetical protein
MFLTNQRLDKLAASRVDLIARGMLSGPLPALGVVLEAEEDDDDDEDDAVAGPRVTAEVFLARTSGTRPAPFVVSDFILNNISTAARGYPNQVHELSRPCPGDIVRCNLNSSIYLVSRLSLHTIPCKITTMSYAYFAAFHIRHFPRDAPRSPANFSGGRSSA